VKKWSKEAETARASCGAWPTSLGASMHGRSLIVFDEIRFVHGGKGLREASFLHSSLKGIPFFGFAFDSWLGKQQEGAKILVDNMNSYARYRIGSIIHRWELMNQRSSRNGSMTLPPDALPEARFLTKKKETFPFLLETQLFPFPS